MKELKQLLASFPLILILVFNSGAILSILWNLLIYESFDVFRLTWMQASALVLVIDFIKPKPNKFEDTFYKMVIQAISRAIAYWIIYLPLGYILHLIIR